MPDYSRPNRICDLVMKGGITSGVVYPPAIDEIAQRFFLCGVGGTSAGAIAAALAAAAELRRRNGSGEGFEMLARLPEQFGAPGNMLALFKPDAATRGPFKLFLQGLRLNKAGGTPAKLRLFFDAVVQLLLRGGLKPLADNGMGLCSGMAAGNRSDRDPLPPLTAWLSERIDTIAGMPAGQPLTFGDLRHAPPPTAPGLAETMDGTPSIQLQLISTCLTFSRPFALPYLDRRFAFSAEEFGKLFPAYVVDHMVKTAATLPPPRDPLPAGLLPLPVEDNLPVIVAVRMSLSFPVLFSLVPLHYRNYERPDKPMERLFFADGGITSNLPIHFFDSPFPRWPTLAINLQYNEKPKEYGRAGVDKDGVFLAADNRAGLLDLFNQFLAPPTSLGKLAGLLGAVFRSAQTWNDNSFLKLPGYRDRVAEIWLEPNEGGMNLEMPPEVIDALRRKGSSVGSQLARRFSEAPGDAPMSWDGHRWMRFRSTMPALAAHLRALRRSVAHPLPGDRTLWQLLESADSDPSYRFTGGEAAGAGGAEQQRRAVVEAMTRLFAYTGELDAAGTCALPDDAGTRPFCGAPRPPIELQARTSMTASRRAPAPQESPADHEGAGG